MKTLTGIVVGMLLAGAMLAQQGNRPIRVEDRNGKLVGYVISDNTVGRQIGQTLVQFYVHPLRGISDSNAMYAFYATADCTGTAYAPRYSVFYEGVRVGSRLYYPTGAEELSPGSVRVLSELAAYDTSCQALDGVTYTFGALASVEISSLGLQPPFRAVQ